MEPTGKEASSARTGRPRRRWRRRLLGVLLGLVLAAVLVEMIVRFGIGVQPKFPRHVVGAPWGLRYNRPGTTYRHHSADGTWEFRINAQGMRADRDFPKEKPAGVRRIVSLGDSYAVGYEVDVRECYSSVLERALRETGIAVEVLNAGVSGFSTAEELLYLERELLGYDPDVVLVGFYFNDLEDTVRSGLFRLEDGVLKEWNRDYVPAGGFGDFLNSNPVFNWLSERSDAFAWAKFQATMIAKRSQRNRNREAAGTEGPATAGTAASPFPVTESERRLTAAVFERLYATVRSRGIPLVILDIPFQVLGANGEFLEGFPRDLFETGREGMHYLAAKGFLEPHRGRELLTHQRSMWHWTPFAHDLCGRELARRMIEARILR